MSERREERVSLGVDGRLADRSDASVLEEREGLGTVDGKEVREHTTDVGGSHRSTGDGVGRLRTSVPGGKNVKTWGEDVDTLPVVGEVGTLVAKSRGTDRDGLTGSSGRVVAGVLVVTKR